MSAEKQSSKVGLYTLVVSTYNDFRRFVLSGREVSSRKMWARFGASLLPLKLYPISQALRPRNEVYRSILSRPYRKLLEGLTNSSRFSGHDGTSLLHNIICHGVGASVCIPTSYGYYLRGECFSPPVLCVEDVAQFFAVAKCGHVFESSGTLPITSGGMLLHRC
eukprot:1889116-Pyramimonas_sp.AAC.2